MKLLDDNNDKNRFGSVLETVINSKPYWDGDRWAEVFKSKFNENEKILLLSLSHPLD